ncbi:MAG: S41 family peptidase [Elusimicrobia bacterium]|nr:S41 family peptidase [Elusimicrobiota bacterium]
MPRPAKESMKKLALSAALAFAGIQILPAAVAAADRTYEQLKIIVDILDYIKENYVDEIETQKLIYGAASGMVKTLDPFSQFMEPEVHKDIKTETEGQFGGLGIRIAMDKDGWLSVITPLPGTPAFRLGVLPNDRIIKIEGESTKDMSLTDAVKKLRGTPGTKVAITVAREPEGDSKNAAWTTHEFTIVREIIKIESVRSRMLGDKIGYTRITEFSAHTPEDLKKALNDLRKDGMNSLVLDLRNNPGGLLSAAVEVSSTFIGEGTLIVYTQGRRSDSRQDFRADSKAPYGAIPMVLLTNRGSASGSEIVAGALQDHRRAVVIGDRTFGKFSVQSVIPLADGSGLRLTVARYYTPLGRSIARDEKKDTGGISPDIQVLVPRETEIKLMGQTDEIYTPGGKPKSATKPEDQVKDEVLERAMEILKAREVLANLKVHEG